jgi:hypothetical protein
MASGKDTTVLEQIAVKTQNSETLRPLLRSALQRELKLLEQGIRQTHARLAALEKQYNLSTNKFLRRFNKDDLGETMNFIDWYGETKMLASLHKQKKAIEGIVVS